MAGLIETPGLKGEIRIPYDMTRGIVNVYTNNLPYPQIVQLLLAATAATVNQWIQAEAGIIRPKGTTDDGSQETSDPKNDDDNR
jgi:hypothetical protein